MFVSFTPTFNGPSIPGWIDGWERQGHEWRLRVLRRDRGRWVAALQDPVELHNTRAFEPATPGLKIGSGESRRCEIRDLSALSALLEPREVLGPVLGCRLHAAGHAIYCHETDDGRVLIPSWLLIDQLWVWSARALRALLTPNSLDLMVGCVDRPDGTTDVRISPELAPAPVTKIAATRASWLSRAEDARRSWGSVLTNALSRRIDLTLPKASMRGWAWGVHVRAGLLVCELSSVEIREGDAA